MSMTKHECEKCQNSRPIISENGWHYICTLSVKKSLQCLLRNKKESKNEALEMSATAWNRREKMDIEKLQEILKNHKLWIEGEETGIRANLSGANLSEANLSRADLSRADLSEANLSRADLSGANLSEANLSRADLIMANLRRADLSEANLSRADLSGANLSEANLSEANLSRAKGLLSAANYLDAHFDRTTDGYIVYKTFGSMYAPPQNWKIEHGAIIEETANHDRCTECGSGINVAPLKWVKEKYHGDIWKCLIKWEWLPGVVVPYMTDGKIRCEKLQLLEVVER